MKLTREQVADCLSGFVYFDSLYGKHMLEPDLANWNVDHAIDQTTKRINQLFEKTKEAPE